MYVAFSPYTLQGTLQGMSSKQLLRTLQRLTLDLSLTEFLEEKK